jgi:hypothetical protein
MSGATDDDSADHASSSEPAKEAGAPGRPSRGVSLALPLAVVIAGAVLFGVLGKSGIWDPYELDSADLARRVAVSVFGAHGLALPGANNALPTLSDLKMGELPFTSMALGFRLLGMHDWSGRLPLALWAFAGALALCALLTRVVGRRAGLYGTIALVTMPLYVQEARTMLGDAVTMSAVAMAFSGLLGAMLDDGSRREGRAPGAPRPWIPACFFAVGVLGLVAGYLSRGLFVGVAIPAASVGLTWVLTRVASSDERGLDGSDVVGGLSLLTGLVAVALGVRALGHATADAPVARALGFALLKKVPTEATFDLVVRQLGHALFPWSAFLPFAIGRLFRPPARAPHADRDAEAHLRVALLVGAGVALGVHTFLVPYAGALAFSGVAILAAIAAVAVVDFERGAPPSRALALGVLLLGFVLYRDLVLAPERALAAFAVDRPAFPKSFEETSGQMLRVVLVAFAGLVALTWLEAQPKQAPGSLRAWGVRMRDAIRDGWDALGTIWNGNLLFFLIVVEAALVGLAAMIFVGRMLAWPSVTKLPKMIADAGVNLWWAMPLALALAIPGLVTGRDVFRALVRVTRVPRAAGTMVAALLAGSLLGFGYYPALAAQLSPKEVFEAYATLRKGSEPLGLLGVRSRAAAYYRGGEVETLADATHAFDWLTEANERRWLIVEANDLPKLNSLYRKARHTNLPVLDGRSSQILLVSNELGAHENESWLAPMILDTPPPVQHPVDAAFDDELEVVGWTVMDQKGRTVPSVTPQTKYHMRFVYRVLRPITSSWKAFIHIDGQQRRYNGDHQVLDGKYPMSLWQPGDIVVDDYEVQLEPNFTPGQYTVFFGFFTGEKRFSVSRGAQQDNRVNGGVLVVR